MAEKTRYIGDILLERKAINEQQLEQALTLQKNCPMPLGQILIGEGFVRHHHVRDAISTQSKLPIADLISSPPANDLLKPEQRQNYILHGLVPWQRDANGITTIAVTKINDNVKSWIKRHYGDGAKIVLTSLFDIQKSVAARFQSEDTEQACYHLARKHPQRSALKYRNSGYAMMSAIFLASAVIAYAPAEALAIFTIALLAFYMATMIFKAIIFTIGMEEAPYKATRPPLPDAMLPVYTILVPLYQEQAALPGLLNSLRNMDYPKSKMDVKLLVEADDEKTVKALKALNPESYFEIIEIPPSEPRTKPKALNYGLRFARGTLVAVYDAEDQPDPLQLRKAASYFSSAHGKTVCLQARLNYYNRERNLLTRLFSIEYAAWFNHMLRGLEKIKMPIPLGGTSNHIELSTVEKMAAWDPFNVTEDADLGMRIYSHGGSCGLLDSTTMEEAPSTIGVWLYQRTRWIKGYMQTYLVCMRSPLKRLRRCGWKDFFGIQLFIGGPVAVFLLSPFLWLAGGLWASGILPPVSYELMLPIAMLGMANLMLGAVLHFIQALIVVKRNRWHGMFMACLSFPFYWILHSIAGFRALWQLITRPYYWDKTPHFYG